MTEDELRALLEAMRIQRDDARRAAGMLANVQKDMPGGGCLTWEWWFAEFPWLRASMEKYRR